MDLFKSLIGTTKEFFRIGFTGPRLKNSSGSLQVRNAGDTAHAPAEVQTVKLLGANASNGVVLSVPSGLSANQTFVLPGEDGATGQFLKTDGAGTLDWADSTSNGVLMQSEAFTEATSSPLTIFTPPANAIIKSVTMIVSSAAGGGSPTFKVGTSGDDDAYMATTDNNLKEAAGYQNDVFVSVGGSPDPVIATIVASSQTFSGVVYVEYSNPN